jgi:hypothetical protein
LATVPITFLCQDILLAFERKIENFGKIAPIGHDGRLPDFLAKDFERSFNEHQDAPWMMARISKIHY